MHESLEKEEGISECCGAPIYRDRGICSDCMDHTSKAKVDDSRVEYLGHKHGN